MFSLAFRSRDWEHRVGGCSNQPSTPVKPQCQDWLTNWANCFVRQPRTRGCLIAAADLGAEVPLNSNISLVYAMFNVLAPIFRKSVGPICSPAPAFLRARIAADPRRTRFHPRPRYSRANCCALGPQFRSYLSGSSQYRPWQRIRLRHRFQIPARCRHVRPPFGQGLLRSPVNGKVTGAVFVGDGKFVLAPTHETNARASGSSAKMTTEFTEQFDRLVLRSRTAPTTKSNKAVNVRPLDGCGPLKDSQYITRHRIKRNLEARSSKRSSAPARAAISWLLFRQAL